MVPKNCSLVFRFGSVFICANPWRKGFVEGIALVQRRSGRIAQRNELAWWIFRGRERCLRIGVDDRQHLTAANSPDRQALTLHGKDSIFFAEDCPRVTHI